MNEQIMKKEIDKETTKMVDLFFKQVKKLPIGLRLYAINRLRDELNR